MTLRTFRMAEDGYGVVLDEHHLFDARYGVDVQALQRALQALVIGASGLVRRLLLSAQATARSYAAVDIFVDKRGM